MIWGDHGEHQIELNQWDCISLPTGMMRMFSYPNDPALVIYPVVGGADEEVGRIKWHPDVQKAAEGTGPRYDETSFLKNEP